MPFAAKSNRLIGNVEPLSRRDYPMTPSFPRRKVVTLMGGALVGSDPFSPRTWSGCSRQLLNACSDRGLLQRAVGVDASRLKRWFLIARNFTQPRETWRQRYYLDTQYYKWLTQELEHALLPSDFQHTFLQFGGIYNIPAIVKGQTRCFSYHDGNVAQLAASPHFQSLKLSAKIVEQAFAYESEVYQGMDKILTMSDYLRRSFIQDFGIPEDRVITIGAGINLDQIPDPPSHKDYDQKSILFVGIDFARKGGWQLLEAFQIVRQRHPKAQLHIVGPQNMNIPSHLAKGVTCYGFLSKTDPLQMATYQRLLSDTSLFVMPSLYEPFGIAPLETMLYEVACVLPNAWAFPEMVTPGHNGQLFQVGQVEDLAETITTLFNNPEDLARMGQNARNVVLERFTWKRVAERLEHVLAEEQPTLTS
ncbi:MAG: glycosyltransferase family 1 protein [Deltaproteobacteria bacterium]|nr:MAG: glycosyltransferase family 1 protein [Deltaproteobacteria bacterium]